VPEEAIVVVSAAVSSNVIELKTMAIANAETCSAGMLESARPLTKNSISPLSAHRHPAFSE
jgi:hypothetical protein